MADWDYFTENVIKGLAGNLAGKNRAMMDMWQQTMEKKNFREQQRQFDIQNKEPDIPPTFDEWLGQMKIKNFDLLDPVEQKKLIYGDLLAGGDGKGPTISADTPGGRITGPYDDNTRGAIQTSGGHQVIV